jgi:hypothetical protein
MMKGRTMVFGNKLDISSQVELHRVEEKLSKQKAKQRRELGQGQLQVCTRHVFAAIAGTHQRHATANL